MDSLLRQGIYVVPMDTLNFLKKIKLLGCIQTYILLLDMEENFGYARLRSSTISVEDWKWALSIHLV